MTTAFKQLLSGPVTREAVSQTDSPEQQRRQRRRQRRRSTSGATHPRLLTLGGDHSIALPILESLHHVYGPISVLHFDSHLDTWSPGSSYPVQWTSATTDFTHGTMFHLAAQSGFIANGTSVHAGLRTRLAGDDYGDYRHDAEVGFKIIEARDMDSFGVEGIVEMILDVMGGGGGGGGGDGDHRPVYLSIDIDVLDPGLAPGTGTPESGGWTMREMLAILRGVRGLNLVGADIVEVSPAYDNAGETTSLAAADLAFEILGLMVGEPGMEVEGYVPARQFSEKLTPKSWGGKEGGVVGAAGKATMGKRCSACGGDTCHCQWDVKAEL